MSVASVSKFVIGPAKKQLFGKAIGNETDFQVDGELDTIPHCK